MLIVVLFFIVVGFLLNKALRPAETPLTQAQALIRAGKAAAALPILEQQSLAHPENHGVFPLLAQGYLSTDRVAEGRIALDTALKMELPAKDLIPAVLSFASYYAHKGDFAEADKLLQSASSACPVETLNAERAQLYYDWAEMCLAQNKLIEAVAHYEQANGLATYTTEPLRSLIPHRLSEGYKRLAALAETEAQNDQQAIALLEKSLQASDEPGTRMLLANLYDKNENTEKAMENYQKVVEEDKNNLEARHQLIDLLIDKGDYEQAQNALVELTDQEKSEENYQQLVTVDLKLKNYAGAVHALEDACALSHKPELLKQLLAVLNDWFAVLSKEKKLEEAASVKGHADRVAELLAEMAKADKDKAQANLKLSDIGPGVALISSRTWLAQGSVTPEGEIKIKNISGKPLTDLTLSAVFFDNTARRNNGTVNLPVVTPNSPAFQADDSRTLYFSCPNIVKADHQLAVLLFWKGRFLKEFPIVKQYGH
jgi:tetratricopeptide (TPR) repeat protein